MYSSIFLFENQGVKNNKNETLYIYFFECRNIKKKCKCCAVYSPLSLFSCSVTPSSCPVLRHGLSGPSVWVGKASAATSVHPSPGHRWWQGTSAGSRRAQNAFAFRVPVCIWMCVHPANLFKRGLIGTQLNFSYCGEKSKKS